MRLGAIKKTIQKPNLGGTRGFPSQPMTRPFNPPPLNSFGGGFNEVPDTITPIEDVEKEPRGAQGSTPQDWLKPKIFKGGSGGLV